MPRAGTQLKARSKRRGADRDSSREKERKYACTLCAKKFARPSSLVCHQYTHTGEQPHECTHPNCGKRFSVRSNLRRHNKIHERASKEIKEETPQRKERTDGVHKNGFGDVVAGFSARGSTVSLSTASNSINGGSPATPSLRILSPMPYSFELISNAIASASVSAPIYPEFQVQPGTSEVQGRLSVPGISLPSASALNLPASATEVPSSSNINSFSPLLVPMSATVPSYNSSLSSGPMPQYSPAIKHTQSYLPDPLGFMHSPPSSLLSPISPHLFINSYIPIEQQAPYYYHQNTAVDASCGMFAQQKQVQHQKQFYQQQLSAYAGQPQKKGVELTTADVTLGTFFLKRKK